MAELTTDAQALSEASTTFDGDPFLLRLRGRRRRNREPRACRTRRKGSAECSPVQATRGASTAQKLASIWGGSGSDAYQSAQQRWDSTSEAADKHSTVSAGPQDAIAQVDSAADDAASSLGQSMGFAPIVFDLKAMEPGEAASDSLKYNFGGIEGAAERGPDGETSSFRSGAR